MPGSLPSGREFRYLSFRMFMNGEIPIPADGMIGRWIWTTVDGCTFVSRDIPFEPGWHTYSIDLHDPYNGMPVSSAGCSLTDWSRTGQIRNFRFDPNENWTGNLVPAMVFMQELDWIRLTKMEWVEKGKAFPILLGSTDSMAEIESIEYYYTSNPEDPYQHEALPVVQTHSLFSRETLESSQSSSTAIFLPMVMAGFRSNAITYNWNTTGVAPGEYYICIKASNGISETTTCSDAPVQVLSR
jgi:hypothetical protein